MDAGDVKQTCADDPRPLCPRHIRSLQTASPAARMGPQTRVSLLSRPGEGGKAPKPFLDRTAVFEYAEYMEDLYGTLTGALAVWVEAVTGVAVKAAEFRLPREGQLSLGVFARGGAEEAARRLNEALCPQVREVREKNGWLLFFLSGDWFDMLIEWAKALDVRPAGTYLENRMGILARKGDGPCPDAEAVRQALWTSYLAWRRGFWRESDEKAVLTMTHGVAGRERIALENRCGGAAEAILKLRGDGVKNNRITPAVCAFAADRRGNFAGNPGKTTEKE